MNGLWSINVLAINTLFDYKVGVAYKIKLVVATFIEPLFSNIHQFCWMEESCMTGPFEGIWIMKNLKIMIYLMTLWYIWNSTGYLYLVNGMSGKMWWLSRRNSFSSQGEQNGNYDKLKDTNKRGEYHSNYEDDNLGCIKKKNNEPQEIESNNLSSSTLLDGYILYYMMGISWLLWV